MYDYEFKSKISISFFLVPILLKYVEDLNKRLKISCLSERIIIEFFSLSKQSSSSFSSSFLLPITSN